MLDARYEPQGYNIGVNITETGGQSVPHLHLHIIPRWHNDVRELHGGIIRTLGLWITGTLPDYFTNKD